MAFAGEKCSIQNSGANVADPSVHLIRNRDFPSHGGGLSMDPGYLATGGHSGYQALNLAILAGAKTLLLLGYDAHDPAPGADDHWFGKHPRNTSPAVYPLIRKSFRDNAAAIHAAGVLVLNCSPGSAIDAFERADLADCL